MKGFAPIKIIMMVVAFALACYTGYHFINGGDLNTPIGGTVEKGLDNLTHKDRLSLKKNVVVLGVDERPEEDDPGRSDTLFVVMFDTKNKSINLLSIPRDTRVHIPKYGFDKINHAYPLGGQKLTQATVEEFLGLRIDNYVMVDFKGFTGLVDAIGGVDIEVEENMYYRDSWDGFTIDIKKGLQHLDGKTAIQYVRYRDEEGDVGRVRRQQRFIMAVYKKIASENMMTRIPGLAAQLNSMIKTNLPLSDMLDLGRAMHAKVKEEGLKMATVPGVGEYIGDISYYLPDIKAMRQLMVDMQGGVMDERFATASTLMEREYRASTERAQEKVSAKDNKDKKDKDKDKDKKKEDKDSDKISEKERDIKSSFQKDKKKIKEKANMASNKPTNSEEKSEETKNTQITPVKRSIVIRIVNCSGNPNAMSVAVSRLRNSGFRTISGGSGELVAGTTITSTTNNGAVINKLANIPINAALRISPNGAADCDGVLILGKDFH